MAQELELFTSRNPVAVLTDREEFDKFYDDIRKAVAEFVPDTSTQKGRDAIKALAFKVTKTKTFLDSAGKTLTDDARKTIAAVDVSRRHMREKLEALKDEVRAPLDKWEAAEQERVALVDRSIAGLKNSAVIPASMTFDEALAEHRRVDAFEIDSSVFGNRAEEAARLRGVALDNLTTALGRLKREEEERAELARLRAEKEEREREEAARQRQELERQEAERRERERAEQEAIATARAEKQRQEAEQRAAEAGRQEAQRQADEERQAAEARHQEELRKEREERQRIEAAASKRAAEEEQARREQAARDADKSHRSSVMKAAKEAVMAAGDIPEDPAKKIVLGIAAGEVPNVSLRF